MKLSFMVQAVSFCDEPSSTSTDEKMRHHYSSPGILIIILVLTFSCSFSRIKRFDFWPVRLTYPVGPLCGTSFADTKFGRIIEMDVPGARTVDVFLEIRALVGCDTTNTAVGEEHQQRRKKLTLGFLAPIAAESREGRRLGGDTKDSRQWTNVFLFIGLKN
jgi:hypothetical protein